MNSDSPNVNVAESSINRTDLLDVVADERITDRVLFFRKFLAKGRGISSAVPSSRQMVSLILDHVDFSRPANIVELGAGTGPVTEQILERLRSHHRFVAVENDPDFCNILRRRFPNMSLLQMDASRIGEPLAKMGIHKVDYVLSELPTPNLPPRAMVRLWQWLRTALGTRGEFIQITLVPLFYRAFYDRFFNSVDYRMVWRNFPPGGVYRCSRPRAHLHQLAKR